MHTEAASARAVEPRRQKSIVPALLGGIALAYAACGAAVYAILSVLI
jgi:hypothetical protein